MILMARLAELFEKELEQSVVYKAKEILAKMIIPKKVTGEVVSRHIRKAIRIGAWRYLQQESRVLLIVARRWRMIKSPILRSVLYRIFLEIELFTFRGKALFYEIIISMKNSLYKLYELVKAYSKLLTIGILYLNNPPMYIVYG